MKWPRRQTSPPSATEGAAPVVFAEAAWFERIRPLGRTIIGPYESLLAAITVVLTDPVRRGDEKAWLEVRDSAESLRQEAASATSELGAAPSPRTAHIHALYTAMFGEAEGAAIAIEDGLETASEFPASVTRATGAMVTISGLYDQIATATEEIAQLVEAQAAFRQPQPRREAIPAAVRREVWRRDQGRCVDCQSRVRLEFDHIIPVSRGGANTGRNIELRCETCNRRKGARV
jgi:HNH endonuclease